MGVDEFVVAGMACLVVAMFIVVMVQITMLADLQGRLNDEFNAGWNAAVNESSYSGDPFCDNLTQPDSANTTASVYWCGRWWTSYGLRELEVEEI